MVILIAPDKFKGTLSATAVAHTLAAAARAKWPEAQIELQPLADGGEGTVAALRAAIGGRSRDLTVTGPLGASVDAGYVRLSDDSIVIEVASATGYRHVPPGRRRPLEATSRGVGELVLSAMEGDGDGRFLIGVGDTTSTDGGTGAASALGYRFLDRKGNVLADGGGALHRLARIDAERARRPNDVVALTDVLNPLLGERGGARVYGPQKGAGPDEVELLEQGMATLAERIRADLGLDVAEIPGAGAGGGLGAGLHAFMGATLTSGVEAVAAAVDLKAKIANADLIVTGEGSLDRQTLEGKVPVGAARTARSVGKPCIAVAGRIELSREELRAAGFAAWASLTEAVGEKAAMSDPAGALAEAARAAFDAWSNGGSG